MKRRFLCSLCLILLAGGVVSAEDFHLSTLRLQLVGSYLPGFKGGFSRDPATLHDSLGLGAGVQMEFRRRSLGIEIEASGLWIDAHTSVARYGGYYGVYEHDQTISITRAGIGLNHHFRARDRVLIFAGVRAYAQVSDAYECRDGFGRWSIAPHIGLDFGVHNDSRWFFTADLQVNVLDIDEAGVKAMPQISFGIGRKL